MFKEKQKKNKKAVLVLGLHLHVSVHFVEGHVGKHVVLAFCHKKNMHKHAKPLA